MAPSSLRYTWKDELSKWIPDLEVEKDIQVFKTGKDPWNPDAKFFIFSYELATRSHSDIAKKGFKICIADEAHYLKSMTSLRSKNLVPILM